MRFLLDVNVLLAKTFADHPHHHATQSWLRRHLNLAWATCPLTQAGFLRVAFRSLGKSHNALQTALRALDEDCASLNHEFWQIDTDLRELAPALRTRLIGGKQVTDLQLLLLAHCNRGCLATFDRGIKDLASGTPYAGSVLLLR